MAAKMASYLETAVHVILLLDRHSAVPCCPISVKCRYLNNCRELLELKGNMLGLLEKSTVLFISAGSDKRLKKFPHRHPL